MEQSRLPRCTLGRSLLSMWHHLFFYPVWWLEKEIKQNQFYHVMLVCYSAYFVRNSSIYFHLRNGCMEQNFSERRAFLYEYDVFLFKKYVRRKGICWRLISFPFPLKTMWTPKSSRSDFYTHRYALKLSEQLQPIKHWEPIARVSTGKIHLRRLQLVKGSRVGGGKEFGGKT